MIGKISSVHPGEHPEVSETHNEVSDGVCGGGSGLSDRMMSDGSHPEDSGLLEHPAGQSLGQLHVPCLLVSNDDQDKKMGTLSTEDTSVQS